ncbi:MAG: aminodeoxychorismate synthase component I [Geobacter sp.]|nr:aminodeoxychorismate synthase component I [Geobacter sp.]
MTIKQSPLVMLDSFDSRFPGSWRFSGLVSTLSAARPEEVGGVIAAAEAATLAGQHAVGFIAYEAASALNPELPASSAWQGLPLAWFAIYRERHQVAAGSGHPEGDIAALQLSPELAEVDYTGAVDRIRGLIARGDSYQVNYTFPLSGEFQGEPLELYSHLCRSQRAGFCALLDMGGQAVISASPELFFSLKDGELVTRPMKGTASRGRWPAEDRAFSDGLLTSSKERAENLMIVDLLRNDLGKIAATGSVQVDSLFDIEQYPTVHQMTSTISARVGQGVTLADILRALFPCGSVTGAPKRRSMAIIRELESQPRGVYCGAIGYLSPEGEALFSVAIRTMLLEKATTSLSMGVGSGITFDSRPESEYAEAMGKAAFVNSRQHSLFETMRLENGEYDRLGRHLDRLAASAMLFGFPIDREAALRLLKSCDAPVEGALRVKLILAPSGELSVTSAPLLAEPDTLVIGLAATRVNPDDRLLYHKTTRRGHLEAELSARPDCSELLFVNSRGELPEGTYNNIVLNIGGRLVTPPLACGLLPGVLRSELIDQGSVVEQTVYPEDLLAADEILLVNSLRGIRRAVLAEGEKF